MINTPAFDTRFVRPALRIIALYLSIIVIASITILKPAQAEGTVSPLVTYWGGWNSSGFNCAGLASISAVKSCEMAKGQKITDDAVAYAGKFGIHPSSCPGVTLNDADPIAPYLDVFSVAFYYIDYNGYTAWCAGPTVISFGITTTLSCPANTTNVYPPCVCIAGFQPDPTGTSCVPVSTCTIPPLTKLTDLVAIDFDANPGHRWRPDLLTPAFVEHVACVERETSARGGTPAGTSAYRPEQYQRHLYEIVKKDFQLDADTMAAHPECQTLRDEITREMGNDKVPPPGHGLKFNQPVAVPGSSLHEKKIAFDMTLSGLTDTQMAEVYSICGVTHKAVRGEPWHTQ